MATATEIQVAYETVDPSVHTMDVDQLAPSLMALGNLCKRANAIINGDKATVHVLVESDFEHKCFQITLQVVQDLYSQVQSLLQHSDIRTSKEILEWLGLIEVGLGGFGLIRYLKHKRGRKPDSVKISDKHGTVELMYEGDKNKIEINQYVYNLSRDRAIIASVKGVLQPILSPGITGVEFNQQGRTVESVAKDEAAEIIANETADTEVLETAAIHPQTVDARLTIYSPVFNEESKVWKFIYGGYVIRVDVSPSGIAEDVLRRGTIRIGDAYLAKLEITEHRTDKGSYRNSYRALSFSQFLPAPPGYQMPLLGGEQDDN